MPLLQTIKTTIDAYDVRQLGTIEKRVVACAALSGGLFTPFGQGRHILKPLHIWSKTKQDYKGQCHGLSVLWLKARAEGSTTSVAGFRELGNSPHKMSRVINRQWAQGILDQKRFIAMMAHDGFTFVSHKRFTDDRGLAMGVYIGRLWSVGTRYFLIQSGLHTMAAVSSGTRAWFFDPNGGEVAFALKTGLAAFLGLFFKDGIVKKHYFGGFGGTLNVHEFRR